MAEPHRVTSAEYPYIPVRLEIRGQQFEQYALLDTGFTGELAIPATLLATTIDVPDEHADWELADGSIIDAPIYLGTLEILGLPPILSVAVTTLGNEFILGRGILDLCVVAFERGERVIIEA